MSVSDVAEYLQVPRGWVYRNISRLGGFKVGKYWRFRFRDLEAYLDGQQRLARTYGGRF